MLKQFFIGSLALLSMTSQAAFADTETKSTAPQAPGHLFTVSTIGNQLTINTTIPGRTYQFAGITSLTPGFSFAPCTTSDNGYCLYTVSDTLPANPSLVGNAANPTFKLCLDGAGKKYSCEKKTIGSRFAYITTGADDHIEACSINSRTGLLSNCQSNPAINGSQPYGVALNPGGTFIYTGNNNDAYMQYCPVIPATGLLGTCIRATAGTASLAYNFDGIVFNSTGTIIYGADQNNNIYKCPVSASGNVPSCVNQLQINSTTGYVNRITINPTGTKLYVTYGSTTGSPNDSVYQCNVDALGNVSTCVNAVLDNPNPFANAKPIGITLNAAGTIAYITNTPTPNVPGTNYVNKCNISPTTGSLSGCIQFTVPGNYPEGVHLDSTGTRLYVAITLPVVSANSVVICPVDPSTGNLSTCTASGAGTIYTPRDITLL